MSVKKAGYRIKTSAPGSSALPPEAVVTEYPAQLTQVGLSSKTLASTDLELSDSELLTAQGLLNSSDPDLELLSPDTIEADVSVEEENPYTEQDALRYATCHACMLP